MKSISQSKTAWLHGMIMLVMSLFIGLSQSPTVQPEDANVVITTLREVGVTVPTATGALIVSVLTLVFRLTGSKPIVKPSWLLQIGQALKENFGSGTVAKMLAALLFLPLGHTLWQLLSEGLQSTDVVHLARDGLPSLMGLAALAVYTKEQLSKEAEGYFKDNPDKRIIYATSDGNFFWRERDRDGYIAEEVRHRRVESEASLTKFMFTNSSWADEASPQAPADSADAEAEAKAKAEVEAKAKAEAEAKGKSGK